MVIHISILLQVTSSQNLTVNGLRQVLSKDQKVIRAILVQLVVAQVQVKLVKMVNQSQSVVPLLMHKEIQLLPSQMVAK